MVVSTVSTDNTVVPYLKDIFVSVVCRLTTVAALLLHLIFGCSLHHAAACGHHDHDGCQHTCSAADSPSVHDDHVCGHDHEHDCSGEEETVDSIHNAIELAAPCCACESQPCDGNHPGCHGVVECSFVPSRDVVFIIDAPLVAFVTYEHDPMIGFISSLSTRRLQQRSPRVATDSLSHCASLCTWII